MAARTTIKRPTTDAIIQLFITALERYGDCNDIPSCITDIFEFKFCFLVDGSALQTTITIHQHIQKK